MVPFAATGAVIQFHVSVMTGLVPMGVRISTGTKVIVLPVMAGLVPAIYATPMMVPMAGTGPAMTVRAIGQHLRPLVLQVIRTRSAVAG